MLVHLPRGNKLKHKNNHTLFAINSLIQGIGKNQLKRRVAQPIGKKTREKLLRLMNKYINETNKKNKIHNQKQKKTVKKIIKKS